MVLGAYVALVRTLMAGLLTSRVAKNCRSSSTKATKLSAARDRRLPAVPVITTALMYLLWKSTVPLEARMAASAVVGHRFNEMTALIVVPAATASTVSAM